LKDFGACLRTARRKSRQAKKGFQRTKGSVGDAQKGKRGRKEGVEKGANKWLRVGVMPERDRV